MDLREHSLKSIFIQYFVTVAIGILLVLIMVSISINVLVGVGIILPANNEEKIIYTLKEQLEGKEILIPEDFEQKCSYALFDVTNQLVHTNIKEINELKDYMEGNKPLGKYYVTIQAQNNYAILEYELVARYSSPFLQRYFPSVEVIHVIILISTILVVILIISNRYTRKLKRALEPLEKAVAFIEEQNLDFEIEKSTIKEFDAIGKSLESMKVALQESLLTQWLLEKKKGEQMASLAHDIKTPLTIIKGSAELLEEDEGLSKEQHALSISVKRNSEKIEEYIKLLMEISNEGIKEQLSTEVVNITTFLKKILEQSKELGKLKSINIVLELPQEDIVLNLDTLLMSRALMNIIGNAIDYTPKEKQLSLKVEKIDAITSIHIVDEGGGFTREAIQKGCEAFYMGDESRQGKGHYGMGLYIAKQIVKRHHGNLFIQNNEKSGGGEVIINLPVLVKTTLNDG
ncbi:MAG: HAMP domain-containing sensor histidine kinase [Cellulosilyticaceae bacterium]